MKTKKTTLASPYDCTTCTRTDCAHRDAFRRLPHSMGGLDLCPGYLADGDNPTTTPQTDNPFTQLMRDYETAHATGADTTTTLLALGTACAQSVLTKCADPQRKTAIERETVSNTGLSPVMVALKRGIVADLAHLDNLQAAHNAAYALSYTDGGDLAQTVADHAAEKAAAALQSATLSDGLDLVNTAVVAILEQTAEHATAAPGWLEAEYTVRRVNRKVLIRDSDTAAWEDMTTTPIQEVYRAVRREVQKSRAMQTDPRNGYLYIEDLTADPDSDQLETIYRRLHKWADLGGYTHTGEYTADAQTAADYNAVIAALNLTDRQAQIVRLRMSGYGYKAIAQYLGIKSGAVQTQVMRLRSKCEKLGFTPGMWADMTGTK